MQIFTKLIVDMESGEELLRESYEYFGPVDMACGTSSQQQNAYNQAQNVQQDFVNNMNTVFSQNQGILKNITSSLTPTVAAGPGQYGFSPAEDAARKSNILATNAAATRQASGSAGESIADIGGGNQVLPSGSKDAIMGNIAEKGAQTGAAEIQNEQAQGFAQGNANYNNAVGELGRAPGELENPATEMENSALQGTENLSTEANQITASNRAWEKPVMGALGSIADVATVGLSGAAGKVGDVLDSTINSQAG